MPHVNHKGPEDLGPKTGRKLGKCKVNEIEKSEMGEIGKGQGLRRHSGGGLGKGKRLRYYEDISQNKIYKK